MSDDQPRPGPPPPPPATTPPPPPPPPVGGSPMAPPSGYVGYSATPMGSVPLGRIGGLARWLVVSTAVVAVMNVISTIAGFAAIDEAEDYLAGRVSEDDFLDAYAPAVLFGFVQSAALLATAVLTMTWMYRVASNHRVLQRIGTWSPGWAIGGWFLPPFVLYVIPYLMLRELWKASDPDVPLGDDRWRSAGVHPIVTGWWVLYGLAPIVITVIQGVRSFSRGLGAGDTEDLAELIDEQAALTAVSSLLTLAAAIAWIVLVRRLSGRHARLTGEVTAP